MSIGGHAASHAQKGGSWDAFSRARASAHEMRAEGGGCSTPDVSPTVSSPYRACSRPLHGPTCKGGTSASVMHVDSETSSLCADLAGMGLGEVPDGKDMRSPALGSSICIGDTNPFVASAFPFGASAAQRAQEPWSRQLI